MPQVLLRLLPLASAASLALAMAPTAGALSLSRGAVTASPRALTVSPEPGTPDASPSTQISILGAPLRRIESVRVTGAVSGSHRGALHAYSRDTGASFVLTRPLSQGERVSVGIRVAGRSAIAFSFTVARLAPTPPIIDIPKLQPAKLQHFVSEPQLIPPRITVSRTGPGLGGDLFLTPLPSPIVHPGSDNAISIDPLGPSGPMIIDRRGRLVWFHQLPVPLAAANLRVQRLDGRPVLTWWQGRVTIAAFGLGEGMVYDTSYRPVAVVRAGNGYDADLHEFVLTPSGDALLTVQSLILRHRPGAPPGTLSPFLDSVVQEVDVRTGLVVWEWHALGHIPVADSYATAQNSPYLDAYHVNSIQELPGHRVLVSARDTSAIYEVDTTTGRVIWTLGGKASTFRMRPGTRFHFQHDARLLPGGRVSLFDDEGGPPFYARASRGLVLGLDLRHHVARLVRQYRRPGGGAPADSEGSLQTLPGGDALVGFGSEPYVSEFAPGGRLVFDASLPSGDGSYRVFGTGWHGRPATRPAVTVRRVSSTRDAVYVSWNGATTVASWQVLAGSGPGRLRLAGSAPNRAFETRIEIRSGASAFQVRALDSTGRVVVRSRMVGAA